MHNPRTMTSAAHEKLTKYSDQLVFWLNGKRVTIVNPDPRMMLAEYLQENGFTGTKVGCGQGGCGACTVMISHRKPSDGTPVHKAVNACLRPLCGVDCLMVTTVEGIGNVHEELDPIQFCIAKYNGTQCGFCTPGFVMNTHAFSCKTNRSLPEQEIEDIYGGNLCRCTGYRQSYMACALWRDDYHPEDDQPKSICKFDPSFPINCRPKLRFNSIASSP